MIPIGFPTAISVSASFVPRFLQAEVPSSHPFSTVLQDAQTNATNDTPEIPEHKSPPARKATARQGQSPDPQSAKPGDQVVPVQTVPGQQLQPISLRLSLSLATGVNQSLNETSILDGASGNSETSSGSPTSQDGAEALPQLAPPLSAIAFSMNLQKAGSPDQKPGSSEQPNTDSTQGVRPSGVRANPVAGSEESSSPDTGSNQPGAQGDKQPDLKLESASEIKQDTTPAEVHNVTNALIQGLASSPVSSGPGVQQTSGRATSDTQPVATPETPDAPSPASARQIDLTVPNEAGHQVDIRISQRGSDVQVTVRTPDSDLAQSLRHNLPELSDTLSRNGLHEEMVHTAQSHSAGHGNSREAPPDGRQQQARQDAEDNNRPAARTQPDKQQTGSFAEIIHEEKRST